MKGRSCGTVYPVEAPKHDASTYRNQRCRCQACKDDHAAVVRRRRVQRRQKTRDNGGIAPVAKHGSAVTYANWGCQCAPCLADHARYEAAAKQRRAAESLT